MPRSVAPHQRPRRPPQVKDTTPVEQMLIPQKNNPGRQVPSLIEIPPPRLVTDAPALTAPTWLPTDSGIGWLDSLGADHRRLLAARAVAARAVAALPERFQDEDRGRAEALSLGLRAGREPDLAPATTPEQRSAAIAAADERLAAANAALDSFLADAIATIEERAPEWLGGLADRRERAAVQRQEAARLLAEAEAEDAACWRLGEWIERNAGTHPRPSFRNVPAVRYVGWDTVESLRPPAPPSDDDRPQLIDPPSLPDWDADRAARATALGERQRARLGANDNTEE